MKKHNEKTVTTLMTLLVIAVPARAHALWGPISVVQAMGMLGIIGLIIALTTVALILVPFLIMARVAGKQKISGETIELARSISVLRETTYFWGGFYLLMLPLLVMENRYFGGKVETRFILFSVIATFIIYVISMLARKELAPKSIAIIVMVVNGGFLFYALYVMDNFLVLVAPNIFVFSFLCCLLVKKIDTMQRE